MKIRHLSGNSEKMPLNSDDRWDGDELLFNREDLFISKTLDEFMRGRSDIEDVMNDPQFADARAQAEIMVSEYNAVTEHNVRNRKYISDSLIEQHGNFELEEEILEIIDESTKNNIDHVTARWVNEWEERQEKSDADNSTRNISKYISDSLSSDNDDHTEVPSVNVKHGNLKKVISLVTLSAAAIVGILIVIRMLAPVNPGKLFDSNYVPLNVVLPAVRSLNSASSSDFASALEKYKAGEYNDAASLFSAEMKKDTSLIAPRFFLGLTEEALGNYSGAASLLSGVTGRAGEYRKDAQWYLGLAYLKLADTEKAILYFRSLAQSPGFYQERAEKLLRRLK